jgi:nicotinate-nucleotide adenylyltransferase
MATLCARVAIYQPNVAKARRWTCLMTERRIGIYAGAFDPVHSGHIGFALQALKAGRLDEIYFMPERVPRGKTGITHYAHRVGMLRQALKPHPNLKILDLPEQYFTIRVTLPRLTKLFPDDQLSLLMGSDVAEHLSTWPSIEKLLEQCELVIGMRKSQSKLTLLETLEQLPTFPQMVTLIDSNAPHLSSSRIRQALRNNLPVRGLLTSVLRYAHAEWLYASIPTDRQ